AGRRSQARGGGDGGCVSVAVAVSTASASARGSRPDAERPQPPMCTQPELVLEALCRKLVGGGGAKGDGCGSAERGDVDRRVALVRDVLPQRVERGVEIGGKRNREGDLGKRLMTPNRGVDNGVGGELAV